MKILSINSLWHLFQWIAIAIVVYMVVHKGIPLSVAALLLFVRLAFRLLFQLIGGIIKIAVIVFILYLLTLIF
jgi:hypothetical protein